VVTGEKYVDLVKEQLPAIPEDQILAEPEGRNTAPCIAYASWKISKKDPDANIVVTPADALVLKTEEFADTIAKALAFTEERDAIVTVGITPSRPETGYGYIHAIEALHGQLVKVSEFKEKPDLDTALAYLEDGHYFWNAGIFVWNVNTIIRELRAYVPEIAAVMDELAPSFFTEKETPELRRLFPTCEKISIDYAVMEKSPYIYVIAEDLAWSDLGSWGSIQTHLKADEDGNAVVGKDVRLFDCQNCFVHTASEKTVVVEGLDGYIVAESKDRLLVCRLSQEQHIKEFSA
jgi:mannose-1-phosphate guanylyltransferase